MGNKDRTTLVLGAGASRSVSYANEMESLSPLDSDFFELMQKRHPSNDKEIAAIEMLKQEVLAHPEDRLWESMERLFYTMYLRSEMRNLLFDREPPSPLGIITNFSRATQSVLRAAHRKRVCKHHVEVLRRLDHPDAIITFNYDLVVERALSELHGTTTQFGGWIYGFESLRVENGSCPLIHKLHGSSNWLRGSDGQFEVNQDSWRTFNDHPGYQRSAAIMLPFWDKKIEQPPWSYIWRKAARQLEDTKTLIVWGYSLPPTDLKARELFRLGLQSVKRVVVIDPSNETVRRWRELCLTAEFSRFSDISALLAVSQKGLAH